MASMLLSLRLLLALVLAAPALTACWELPALTQEDVPDPEPPPFDPANFVDPTLSTNPHHPTRPGLQWVRGGTTEVGLRKVPNVVISTMTDVVRMIDGVPCIAMLDQSWNSGEIAQVGFDYLALDKEGNVWLMGGYAEEYESGQFNVPETAWLGATGGFLALHQNTRGPKRTSITGILVPKVITMETPRWYISTSGDEDPTGAEPFAIGETVTVAFGEFKNVTVVLEGALRAIDNELKYYAPGVGVVFNKPLDASIHQDHFELVNFIELSPAGLADASQVVLDLEEHARTTTAIEVYGSAPKAKRVRQ